MIISWMACTFRAVRDGGETLDALVQRLANSEQMPVVNGICSSPASRIICNRNAGSCRGHGDGVRPFAGDGG